MTLSPHASDVHEASDVITPDATATTTSDERAIGGDTLDSRARGGGPQRLGHVEPLTEKHLIGGAAPCAVSEPPRTESAQMREVLQARAGARFGPCHRTLLLSTRLST